MVIPRACTNATSISASSRCTTIAWRSACKHRLAFGISVHWPYFCLQSQYNRRSKRDTAGRQQEVRRVILVGPQIRPDEPEVLRLQERSFGERAFPPWDVDGLQAATTPRFVRYKMQEGHCVSLPGTNGNPACLPAKYQPFLGDEIPEK